MYKNIMFTQKEYDGSINEIDDLFSVTQCKDFDAILSQIREERENGWN